MNKTPTQLAIQRANAAKMQLAQIQIIMLTLGAEMNPLESLEQSPLATTYSKQDLPKKGFYPKFQNPLEYTCRRGPQPERRES